MTELCVTRRSAFAAALLVAAGAFACKPAEAPPTDAAASSATPAAAAAESPLLAKADQAAAAITPDVLRAPIAELGSDAYEGRDPGSRGDVKAREYLIQQMQQLGLQPGFADGWQQPFDLVSVDAAMPPTWTFTGSGGKSAAFKRKDEFIAASGVQDPKATIKNAEVVFVGYGIQAPEFQWDDFKGQDLKGKVLLMLNNDPDWDDALFAGKRRLYYGRWTYKYESAARQGAAGAIIIHTTPSAGYDFNVVQSSWTGEQFELPKENEPRIQVRGWLTEDASKRLVALGGKDLAQLVESAKSKDFQPVPLGVRTSLTLNNKIRRVQTANVVGKIPGRDETLAQQVVIYTAHHDHLGIGDPDATGDTIYNGARDNASGCAEILAIARAFKALPEAPRRTVMIGFVAGEEQGLLGSKYLAEHPPVPAGRIAADINLDSGNIWGKTKDVTYVGIEKAPGLGELLRRLAAKQEREVKGDQFPDKGFYYRSDQFSFAKVGVPAIYLEGGTDFVGKPAGWGKEMMDKYEEENYHQPSDELTPDWNFDGMVQDAQLAFEAGLEIAEEDAMPTWAPGDEFEAARKQAIEEAENSGAAAAATPTPSPAASAAPSAATASKEDD